MTVVVRLPFVLRDLTAGAATVEAAGETLRAVVAELDARFPGVAGRLLDERGGLRGHFAVFVDGEDVRRGDGLATVVRDGAVVTVQHAMSGG